MAELTRQYYCLKAGNIKNLQLQDEPIPPLQPHEVTVAVEAIGLNFADIFAIWGLYSATPEGVFTPGLEYAGRILAIGKDVENVQVGDQVMGVTRFGAYTTHLNIDSRYVIPLPKDWTMVEGAAFLVQVLTAYYGLTHLGALQQNASVLVHSAAGGVGIWANRIAKKYDAFTIGTVGSSNKVDFCKAEGYDEVIVRGDDFADRLDKALAKRSLDVVMECIGGKIFKIGYDTLGAQGRMIVYGSARYAQPGDRPNYLKLFWQFLTRPKIDPQKMIESNKGILGFNLIYLYEQAPLLHQLLQEIEQLDLGKPHIGHTFPFAEVPEAIRLFQTGKTIGKVVIEV